MKRMLLLSGLVLVLGACAFKPPSLTSFPPKAIDVPLAVSPTQAYARAYKAFIQEPGWMITSANTELRTFQGEVKKAVHMTVMVAPDSGKGSIVTVQGVPVPYAMAPAFTEVDDYAQRLKEAQ
jgi:type II secretory pathway component GspD/PulD (secretin)